MNMLEEEQRKQIYLIHLSNLEKLNLQIIIGNGMRNMKKIILLLIANMSAALLAATSNCYQYAKKDLEAKQY